MLERARAAVILHSTAECRFEAELLHAATDVLDAVRIYLFAEVRGNCRELLPYGRDVVAAHVAIVAGIDDRAAFLHACSWAFGSRWSDQRLSSAMQRSWWDVGRGVPDAWRSRPGRRDARLGATPGLEAPPGLPPPGLEAPP